MTKIKLKTRKIASQERAQETVNSILEASTHILSNEDTAKLSTNRIAEKAGVSIGSLYQYFPNKESILNKLLEVHVSKKLELISERLSKLLESDISNEEGIENFVQSLIDLKIKNLKFERALLTYFSSIGDFISLSKIDSAVIEKISETLKTHKKRFPSINEEWSALILFHALRGVIFGVSNQRKKDFTDPILKKELTKLLTRYLAE